MILSWLSKLFGARSASPGSQVSWDETGITHIRMDGTNEYVTWEELTRVEIVTTDEGPFREDVFWLLHGSNRGCAVPNSAGGINKLLERLQALPGFNNAALIEAMGSATNNRFQLWNRDGSIA